MVTKVQAEDIHKKCRDFYKKEKKSSNKTYDTNVAKDLLAANVRNTNQSQVSWGLHWYRELVLNGSTLKNKSEAISTQAMGDRIGNCGEMALLAAYYASLIPLANEVWLGSIRGSGDHAFCLLGPTVAPAWKTPWDMMNSGDKQSWVVDPWANTCCTAADYVTAFQNKMKDWGSDGKRVIFKSKTVNPDSADYQFGFLQGDLTFALVW